MRSQISNLSRLLHKRYPAERHNPPHHLGFLTRSGPDDPAAYQPPTELQCDNQPSDKQNPKHAPRLWLQFFHAQLAAVVLNKATASFH